MLLGFNGFGQITPKFYYDCNETIARPSENNDIHKPSKEFTSFMAYTDLRNPKEWKNQDTINIKAFTINNLNRNMPIIDLMPPSKYGHHFGMIQFTTLLLFDHGEYGTNSDSSYYTEMHVEKDILTLQDAYWWSKGKGKKYKFKIIWEGINCCKLIRINPTKRKLYPRPISKSDKKKLGQVKNY
jgi:hypothetical protein